MTRNQKVLAKMIALHAISTARRSAQPSPTAQFMAAVDDALEFARQRRDELAVIGEAGTQSYLELCEKIGRWELARRSNR